MIRINKFRTFVQLSLGSVIALSCTVATSAWARDLQYNNEEVSVYVTPGEPTQIQFPGVISGGFKKKQSAISLDRKNTDLVIFAQDAISENGEAIIVRLDDGRNYSLRIKKSSPDSPRDDIVKIDDSRPVVNANSEEEAPYKEKNFEYAPPSQVSGLMREMVLNAEFGKAAIPGYRVSDHHKGETVLNDGTMQATIDKIFIGPNLWGYVIDATNVLDQTQRLNPGSFRLDGTRAISAEQWELSPRPLDAEQEIAAKHKTKIYIVTIAK